MKVMVTQIETTSVDTIERCWESAQSFLKDKSVDLLLFPEIGFFPWIFCGKPENVEETWNKSILSHKMWAERFSELNVPVIVGSRPILKEGKRHNSAFVWTEKAGVVDVHQKFYLPDEPGFWEASWYERGSGAFEVHQVEVGNQMLNLGFMICSDLWFYKHAREYGEQGVHLILSPRSTRYSSKWRKGGQVNSIVSGTFNLSSNHCGLTPDGNFHLGGTSWVTDPDGETLGETTDANPFLVVEIDIEDSIRAKSSYPRYIKD